MNTNADNWDSTISREETYALLDAADIEFEKGNEDEGHGILMNIPLPPGIAMCYATQAGLGPELLKASGLNLKDAERKYGHDWLECF